MTNDAIKQLWDAELTARTATNQFWKLANELVGCGVLRVEDVAMIYGVHPATASKRMRSQLYAVAARTVDSRQAHQDCPLKAHGIHDADCELGGK